MKYKFFTLPLLLLLFAAFVSNAQKIVVNGKIVDEDYEPLIGVTIKVKNAKEGVITNNNGEFKIIAASNAVLVISYIGFATKEEPISNRSSINIQLSKSEGSVEEVIVVGYGTQKKSNVIGSVSSISAKDIQNFPVSNLISALQGQISGLTIVQPSGQPGNDEPDVNIRGISTLGNATPLVIIDGFQASIAALSNLSLTEIENVTVLKDAASAAIYGSRGANGVILVTTERTDNNNKIVFDFNNSFGFQQAISLPKYVDSWDWLRLSYDLQNLKSTADLQIRDKYIELAKSGLYKDSLSNTVWNDHVFRNAPIRTHNFNVRGNTKKLSFQANLGYIDQQGVMKGTSSDRLNVRLNAKYELSKKIKIGINTWMYKKNIYEPFTSPKDIITQIANSSTLIPVKYNNGNYAVAFEAKGLEDTKPNFKNFRNPVLLTELGSSVRKDLDLNLQGFVLVEPIKGLVISNLITVNRFRSEENRIKSAYNFFDLSGKTSTFSNDIIQLNANNDK